MDATELEKNLDILGELLQSRELAYELIVVAEEVYFFSA